MLQEIQSIYKNDPSARGGEFLLYPGLYAIFFHRFFAHPLYTLGLYFPARFVSTLTRFFTGIEIHPGATLGTGIFIDHGMGVVIGETATIGDNCVIFHGVTLGGTGKHTGKRHPTVGKNVLLGAHATLLGPINIGDDAKIGAATVIIGIDVPSKATVVGNPGKVVKIDGKKI